MTEYIVNWTTQFSARVEAASEDEAYEKALLQYIDDTNGDTSATAEAVYRDDVVEVRRDQTEE